MKLKKLIPFALAAILFFGITIFIAAAFIKPVSENLRAFRDGAEASAYVTGAEQDEKTGNYRVLFEYSDEIGTVKAGATDAVYTRDGLIEMGYMEVSETNPNEWFPVYGSLIAIRVYGGHAVAADYETPPSHLAALVLLTVFASFAVISTAITAFTLLPWLRNYINRKGGRTASASTEDKKNARRPAVQDKRTIKNAASGSSKKTKSDKPSAVPEKKQKDSRRIDVSNKSSRAVKTGSAEACDVPPPPELEKTPPPPDDVFAGY